MQAPEAFPVEINDSVAPLKAEPHGLGNEGHGRRAAAKASQDADFHWHAPAPGLEQGRLIEIFGKSG